MASPVQPALAFWTDAEPLECVARLPETPNVVTFTFQAPSGALFSYKAGQFITLELPVPGGPLYRTYTISSSPSRPTSLTVTVKAQQDSIGTRWMLDNLHPGMKLKAVGPAGDFSYMVHPAKKYLFISAGSGITPMMSMTTCMWDGGRDMDVVFLNCASRPSEIIFKQRLEHMVSRTEGLDVAFVVDKPDRYKPWTGLRGHLNQLVLGLVAPDYLEREVFCCGPEGFMTAVREALMGLGFDMDHYHQESFHAPLSETGEIPDDVAPDEDAKASVEFAVSGVTATCTETDTLLNVGKAAGVPMASGCTFGVCGACKVKKVSGEVHMVHNGGITDEDVEEGYVLACCSKPLGKVVLEA